MNHQHNSDYDSHLYNVASRILSMIIILSATMAMLQTVYAYDGDVDYSAPYVTVDPETGKLVTIDPRAKTKTPHEPATKSTATAGAAPATPAPAPAPAQTESVMAQEAITADMNTGSPAETASGSSLSMTAGVIGILLVAGGLFFTFRKKAAVVTQADADNVQ